MQRQAAHTNPDLSPEERQRLGQFLKVMANSVGFGIYVQLDRDDTNNKPVKVDVYTGDGEPYQTTTTSPERPGDYCLPPVAAAVCGAARLMLALLERTVTDEGGASAFCDTDSMAIASTPNGQIPEGRDVPVPVLDRDTVGQIIERFATLNPYDPDLVPGSILEIEDENYTEDGERRRLWCFAISSKRYQLTDAESVAVKSSEHGLGHLQNQLIKGSKRLTFM